MTSGEKSDHAPGEPHREPDTAKLDDQITPGDIEQIIERASAQHAAHVRALSGELGQRTKDDARDRHPPEVQSGREKAPATAASPAPTTAQVPRSRDKQAHPQPTPQAQSHSLHPPPHLPEQTGSLPAPPSGEVLTWLSTYRIRILFAVLGLLVLAIGAFVLLRAAVPRNQIELSSRAPNATGSTSVPATRQIPAAVLAAPSPLATALSTSQPILTTNTAAIPTTPPTLSVRSPVVPESPAPARSTPALLQRVAAAEDALRTGEFEVTIDYGNGSRSSARIRFDFGDSQRAPRFHIVTAYESPRSSQTSEQIAIGNESWRRQPDGSWSTALEQEGAWGQVQVFLPHASSVVQAESDSTIKDMLRWYDASRDADVTLRVDPDTGIPRELRQVTRTTKTVLTVTYSGWNTAVQIVPPNGS